MEGLLHVLLKLHSKATMHDEAIMNGRAGASMLVKRGVCRQNEWDCRGGYLKEALAHPG